MYPVVYKTLQPKVGILFMLRVLKELPSNLGPETANVFSDCARAIQADVGLGPKNTTTCI